MILRSYFLNILSYIIHYHSSFFILGYIFLSSEHIIVSLHFNGLMLVYLNFVSIRSLIKPSKLFLIFYLYLQIIVCFGHYSIVSFSDIKPFSRSPVACKNNIQKSKDWQ